MDSYFYLLIRLLSANKTRSNCAIIGCKLSKKYCIKHRTESQTTYEIISFSLIFTRSYLPIQNLEDRHSNTTDLPSWLVHILCDFKAT